MINRVVLTGRLVADPELRYTPSGVPVVNFRIAVDRRFKPEGGERETDFFKVVAWRSGAEFVANYLAKGRLVGIDGRLEQRRWETAEGKKQSTIDVVADHVQALDKPPGDEDGPPAEAE